MNTLRQTSCRSPAVTPFANTRSLYTLLLIALLASLAVGCRERADSGNAGSAAERPFAGVELSVLVVDDAELAGAIEQNHGEWRARTDGTYTVEQTTTAELLERRALSADIVIYPDALLAELAERGWLMPLDETVVVDPRVDWPDVFEMLQLAETRWGRTTYAAPMGSPLLVCLYRRDLFEQAGKSPPTTWAEFDELSTFFADRANWPEASRGGEVIGSLEPLAEHWAGVMLLVRGAAYAKHRDQYSTFFDVQSGEPLIDTPPFVRALEELVAAQQTGAGDAVALTPADVLDALLAGRAAMAITWPSAAVASRGQTREAEDQGAEDTGAEDTAASALDIGVAPLPGSEVVFHQPSGAWQDRREGEDRGVTVLGVAGRLASIAADSRNPGATAQLIATLCGPEQITSLATASRWCSLSRESQTEAPAAWAGGRMETEAAAEYASYLHDRLTTSPHCFALRLPHRDAYLAALDKAVAAAMALTKSPQDALSEAAGEWRAIARQNGDDSHQQVLRRNLGLAD